MFFSCRRLHFPLLWVMALLLLPSCKWVNGLFGSDEDKIAQMGSEILYNKDVQPMLPTGLKKQDSLNRIRQYVNTWALDRLMLEKAEDMLSSDEKNVEKELANYRRILLVYRYQKKYVEDRIDTLVSDKEIRQYYEEHRTQMDLSGDIVRARFIKIRLASPYLEMVRNLYTKTASQDSLALDRLCKEAADEYTGFQNNWVPLENLRHKLPPDTEGLTKLKTKPDIEIKDNLYSYLIHAYDYLSAGSPGPLEYKRESIRQAIISQRKQDLLHKLETDLIDEAWNSGHIKLYKHHE